MADQDFNIKVVTTADTTGLKQTSAELDSLKKKQSDYAAAASKQAVDAEAKWAASPLNPKNAATGGAAPAVAVGGTASSFGSAAGIGTIIYALTHAITKWREFNAEQDKWVDGMIKAQEKSRELGLSIADMLDAMKSVERIETEPLQVSFDRLKYKVIELKTELQLAFSAGRYEEAKKYAQELSVVESQLNRVTNQLDREKAAADAAAEANEKEAASFLKGAVQTAQPQVQAALQNEEKARQARSAGLERDADLLQKTADQLKKSFTTEQQQEYEGLTKSVPVGRKAGPGESQEALDDIARNQINFQRQLTGQPPLPSGAAQGNADLSAAIQQAFDAAMSKYWGP